jgi:hypothetical protein
MSEVRSRDPGTINLGGIAIRPPREGQSTSLPNSDKPACQVRGATLDNQSCFNGHDKHAPPTPLSEGPACQVCRISFDNQILLRRSGQASPSILLIALPTNPMGSDKFSLFLKPGFNQGAAIANWSGKDYHVSGP